LAKCVLEDYLRRRPTGIATRTVPGLPRGEARLLQEINQGLPETTWRRYHELVARRRDSTLTADEHEELKSLTDSVELAHSRRMERLADLARLRGVSLDESMAELGLRDPGYV